MPLPSVDRLITSARATATRFPFVLASGVLAAAAGIVAVNASDADDWWRLLFASALGLPLFFAVTMVAERRAWPASWSWLARLAGVMLLAAFFLAWPGWSEPVAMTRFVQASVAFHLLVAFAPFLGSDRRHSFWEYNKALFLRFLTAGLYSTVLFVGLAIALAGIDNLLGVDVDGESYARLWLLIAFVFNTWFFLAGVPGDLRELGLGSEYPAGLKVFSQYVLIPLVAVYLLILTLYLGRILLTRTWPSGWIGYLVSSVAAAGILSLLLVHPISERAENRWIETYGRWFYIALLPSIVMLLLAIWQRIDQYGVTERRYFLAVLALWLAGIAIFYVLTRSRDIRVIPVTLCLIAVATFGGPWSAYGVSEGSQVHRLERILSANGMLEEGEAVPATGEVSFEDRREVSAILRYLIETHGTGAIEPLLGGALAKIDTIADGTEASSRAEVESRARLIAGHLGLAYVTRREGGAEGTFHYFADRRGGVIPIAGYDYALRWDRWPVDSFTVNGETLRLSLGPDSTSIRIFRDGVEELVLALGPLYRRLRSGEVSTERPGAFPAELLRVEAEHERLAIVIYLNSLSGRETAAGPKLWSGGGDVYVRFK